LPVALNIEKFLEEGKKSLIIDVRTPAEFEQGHIPGAYNIPLFTNEERAIVGTLYKKTGRQEAIHKGLEIFGPRMIWYIEELKKVVAAVKGKDTSKSHGDESGTIKAIYVHCWRGGMRSGSMAWLFEVYGFKVFTLKKGYKTFRNFVLDELKKERKIKIIGGRTGSGKTLVLPELKKKGIQVIDLEKLAHHKGSSFGSIGEQPQPTQEHFENKLAIELLETKTSENLFLEDESKLIGQKIIPKPLFFQMRNCEVFYFEVPFEERAKYIAEQYGKYPKEELFAATERILRRLDTRFSKDALKFIEEGNLIESFKISLRYYDKTYDFGLSKREGNTIVKIPFDKIDPIKMADLILLQSSKV
jgi:tRNA 2-selenouridine synthase